MARVTPGATPPDRLHLGSGTAGKRIELHRHGAEHGRGAQVLIRPHRALQDKDPGFSKASMDLQSLCTTASLLPRALTMSLGNNWDKDPGIFQGLHEPLSSLHMISLFPGPSPHNPGATGNKDPGFLRGLHSVHSTKSLLPRALIHELWEQLE